MLPDPGFLTVTEVAEALRVSKMTVYRLVNSGDIVAARVGGLIRVRSVHVEAYLTRRFREVSGGA